MYCQVFIAEHYFCFRGFIPQGASLEPDLLVLQNQLICNWRTICVSLIVLIVWVLIYKHMTPFQVDSIISIRKSGCLYLLVLSFRQWSLLQNGCILFNFFPISLACKGVYLILHLCLLCGSMWEVQWDTMCLWAPTPNSWNVVHTKLGSNHKPILLKKTNKLFYT